MASFNQKFIRFPFLVVGSILKWKLTELASFQASFANEFAHGLAQNCKHSVHSRVVPLLPYCIGRAARSGGPCTVFSQSQQYPKTRVRIRSRLAPGEIGLLILRRLAR